ncbi:MAG: hypothetical protein D6795_06155 [Deltaproteobacteria bacterium]|nr:MAG: hypothetical protein D6795_06155 [Deltaproteobacteria bacterium]
MTRVLLLAAILLLGQGCSASRKLTTYLEMHPHDPPLVIRKIPFQVRWVKDLSRGRMILFHPAAYLRPTLDPDGKRLYVGTERNELLCLDLRQGKVLWSYPTAGRIESPPLVHGERIYAGDDAGNLYALTRKEGRFLWRYTTSASILSELRYAAGKILFATTTNELYAVDAQQGTWSWQAGRDFPRDITIDRISSPAVDGDRVYIGFSDGFLGAYALENGAELWTRQLMKGGRFNDIDATPVVDERAIYVAGYPDRFFALDKTNGHELWHFEEGGVERAAMAGDTIYLSTLTGHVHALRKKDGKRLWSFFCRDRYDAIFSDTFVTYGGNPTAPALLGDYLVVGTGEKDLFLLDRHDGTPLVRFPLVYGTSVPPLTRPGSIFVVTNGARLIHFSISPASASSPPMTPHPES